MTTRVCKELREAGVTSFYLGCISASIHCEVLCFRAFFSADLLKGIGDEPKFKFPGGKMGGCENIEETAFREWQEEVLRPHTKVSLDFSKAHSVYVTNGSDQEHQGGIHQKRFYLFWESDLAGFSAKDGDRCFRVQPKIERDVTGKTGGILYPSAPYAVHDLSRLMYLTKSWSHRTALVMAVRHIAKHEPREVLDTIPTDFLRFVHTDEYQRR